MCEQIYGQKNNTAQFKEESRLFSRFDSEKAIDSTIALYVILNAVD